MIEQLVAGGPLLAALGIALVAGLVSFASPCVLPLVPGYLGFVGGMNDAGEPRAAAARRGRFDRRLALGAALFVLGFSVVFVLSGWVFGALGMFVVQWRLPLLRISGALVVLLGLVFIGAFGPLQRIVKPTWAPRAGLIGAPLLGVIFAVGWSPCLGPTLTAIYSLGLGSGSAWRGALLAASYCVGLGVPFLLVAAGLGWATRASKFLQRHIRVVNIIGGVLLIAVGVTMLSGAWLELTGWLQSGWSVV